MEPIHILSTRSFTQEWLDRLQAVSPRIIVRQHTCDHAHEIPAELLEWAHILYTWGAFPEISQCANLRWVQLDTSGSDAALASPLGKSDVAITTLIGVAPPNMAEHTFMMMMAMGRKLPLMIKLQMKNEWPSFDFRWENFTPNELFGATVGIVGYGSIGKEIGRLAHAFNMRVIAITRPGSTGVTNPLLYQIPTLSRLTSSEPDAVYPSDRILDALPQCDYLVLCVPHTPDSNNLMNEAAFRAMKPTSILINVARGGVVDETAMIHALNEGWIAGASLDVFEQEPLPADSPLWQMENVIISPHVAGFTSRYYDVVLDLFSTNLRRYIAGEPLLNQVWPRKA